MLDKCKICQSENVKKVKIGDTELIKCDNCNVYYLADFGDIATIENYYKSDYKITSSDIIETEARRIFRIPEQIELIGKIMSYKRPPAKLIDIGCDKGFFIDEARRYGYDCTGIELSETARRYTDNIGLNVVADIETTDSKFDIAVMWHSLEHFHEPLEFLQNLKELLNDEAYLFVRVPAFDCSARKFFGKRWIWFQPQNHFFHYSWQSLQKLLVRAGYSVELIVHRKPNDRFTKRMFKLVSSLFGNIFGHKPTLRKRLSRKYEDWTGTELLAIAKYINKSNE